MLCQFSSLTISLVLLGCLTRVPLVTNIGGLLNTLQTVTIIDFYFENNLNGTIPSSIGNLTNLQEIRLYSNPSITGAIPIEICNLHYLYDLEIGDTNLFGNIPIK